MAGRINLQANDGKVLSLTAPEGMSSNTTDVVATRGYVDSELALHSTDALGISGNTLYLYKGNGANESVTLPVQTSVTGNAGTATKLATARTITLSGDVTGSVSFDGSANTTITATVADDSHNHVISNVDGLQTALDGKLGSTATATTATKLATARTINGVAFDGSENITVYDSTKAPLASPAFTGTPTAPTASTDTNTTQIATTAFVKANSIGIGIGQTWQNVTASRSIGTTYTNSTGKPIMVIVSFTTTTNAINTAQLSVNAVAVSYSVNQGGTGGRCSVCAIVPNGATYVASKSGNTYSLWMELG